MSMIKSHPLTAFKKGGKYLICGSTLNTDEYVRETYSLSLNEYLVNDGHNNYIRRYRLYSRDPMSVEDSMEYDIECPHCHSVLRICGETIDSHNHGLYKCRACEKH